MKYFEFEADGRIDTENYFKANGIIIDQIHK